MPYVYIHSAPENLVPELALNADRVLEDRWNGWLRPLATAREFGVFLAAWRRNDPNGTWGSVTEVGAMLNYVGCESDEPEEFPSAGWSSGEALYDLTGWVWIPETWRN